MHRFICWFFVYAYTLSFVGAQDRQVVVEAAPLAMEVNHVRCMILPTIFPTNISTSCVSFKDWYEKVDLQYGSLRATINTADIVILPLMATPSLPPYKGQPIFGAPEFWFTSMTSLGGTHAGLANVTTLRSSKNQISQREDLLNNGGVKSLGLAGLEEEGQEFVVIEEVRGMRLGICSFIYPFEGDLGVSGYDVKKYSRLVHDNADSIDFWIAIPYWRDGQYGRIQQDEQQQVMRSMLNVGFNIVVGYASKHLSMESLFIGNNQFALFDVGSALPESVSQTCSGAILEVSIHPKDGSLQNVGLIPTYPLLTESTSGGAELRVMLARDLEEGHFLSGLQADQKSTVDAYMKAFRSHKPTNIQEFYYPQSPSIRDNASHAVQLERGWNIEHPPPPESNNYAVQFLQMSREITLDTSYYTYLKGYYVLKEKGRYHYILGKSLTLEEAKSVLMQLQLKSHDFSKIVRLNGSSIIPHTFTH